MEKEQNNKIKPNNSPEKSAIPEIDEDFQKSDEMQTYIEKHISRQMFGMISQESSVMEKITPEHINKYLDASQINMEKGYQERRENKYYIVAILVLILVFAVALIFLLQHNPSLLEKIIPPIITLVAGAFGGYGYGVHKKQSNDD